MSNDEKLDEVYKGIIELKILVRGEDGLVHRVKMIEQKQNEHTAFQAKVVATAGLLGALLAVVADEIKLKLFGK
jgi:hypothetical protein